MKNLPHFKGAEEIDKSLLRILKEKKKIWIVTATIFLSIMSCTFTCQYIWIARLLAYYAWVGLIRLILSQENCRGLGDFNSCKGI